MTLCYEDEDGEGNTEIFIGEILLNLFFTFNKDNILISPDDISPEGLAARDGRLRLGDQIIQIQGVKVFKIFQF